MNWVEMLSDAIEYIETNIMQIKSAEEVAAKVNFSSFYFQKVFKLMTGYSISEYIRYRKLYLAALEILQGKEKVIDLAFRYGYETPESFSKAFTRFHGISPIQIKTQGYRIKPFLPLKVSIEVKGGDHLDYSLEEAKPMKLIGLEKRFTYEEAFQNIPDYWDKFCQKVDSGEFGEVLNNCLECCVGKYGVCISSDENSEELRYLIAGDYYGGIVPDGFQVIEIPGLLWAKFRCIGPMPVSIQSLNTRIFKEWFPANPQYTISAGYNIELYSRNDIHSANYYSEVWIPVRKA